MRVVTAAEIEEALTWADLIEALREAFRGGIATPPRHHHTITRPGGSDATLLVMPAWTDFAAQGHAETGFVGVKVVSVFPDNARLSRSSVSGVYLLLSGRTGEPVAALDGRALTLWRTAAASALAARYLAREDASRLLLVGAGALAPYLIRAHASVRPISEVLVWNRSPERAEAVVKGLSARLATEGGLARWRGQRYSVGRAADLEEAVRGADIVSCATLSSEPLVQGAWLKPGAHLDLVG
ncbi:MAG: ornithine cyclodeaminase family protein, partial [Pseudomonadota bacterium]